MWSSETLIPGYFPRSESNYVSGLFLSSGIIQSPDYTMEQLIRVAKVLREEHQFRGYIHLKTIPEADLERCRELGAALAAGLAMGVF